MEIDDTTAYVLIIILILFYVFLYYYFYSSKIDIINKFDNCITKSCNLYTEKYNDLINGT